MRTIVAALCLACVSLATAAYGSERPERDSLESSHHRQARQAKPRRTVERHRVKHYARHQHKSRAVAAPRRSDRARVVEAKTEMQILPHPPGCPARSFCGCGVALHIFGKPIRELWLAANWLKFPRAEPAPGMVAARRGHVFAILRMIAPGLALAYDPNSGGHRTRIHARRLAGYRVVNPNGARYAAAGI